MEQNKEYRIGWYSRDGYIDFYPLMAEAFRKEGYNVSSYHACNYSLDVEYLSARYGIKEPWVLSRYQKSRKWDISDNAIRDLEKKFNARSLTECLWPDRFEKKLKEDTQRENIVSHFAFWEDFIKTNKIDILVSEFPSILATCVAWVVCQKYGVQFLSFGDMPIQGDRVGIITSWEGHYEGLLDAVKNDYMPIAGDTELDRLTKIYLEDIKCNGVRKTKKAIVDMEEAKSRGVFKGIFFKDILNRLEKIKRDKEYYVYDKSFILRLINRVKAPLYRKMLLLGDTFNRDYFPDKERYFFFPLHMPGEWSNYSFLGLRNADQVAVVREASYCLPLGAYLYVKEHTTGFGNRNMSFYKEIKKIPNVRLINPYANTMELIKKSQAVVTLGSTVGFETFLLRRPVIYWGEPWYRGFFGMYKANTPEQLSRLMQNAGSLHVATDEEVYRCIRAMFASSFQGFTYPLTTLIEESNIYKFVRATAKYLIQKFSIH
ncbi:capsule polysaccharide biosynthesis family protein [Candidatus Omnitrophus magneticus]|uniref:Capsule polysaccharide biosynthesis family protein n=1 Tax=Candidatus Omnitrophus magneticus TaxID=1609969 RepID=A0A0F0CSD6_9BACT|nr:capsule polysaccharide biosynthesis family protein [Candidatus Omnitrophus magneticus]